MSIYIREEEEDLFVVLFLTNNVNTMKLHDWLEKKEKVILFNDVLIENDISRLKPNLVISYNYKHILKKTVIDLCNQNNIPMLNLHISYLPWNKGANPNYWSFIDNTPKGITIHKIAPKVDAGNIVYRKEIFFDSSKETFSSTYQKLNDEIVNLFINKWDEIKSQQYIELPQETGGSYHNVKDFNRMIEKCPVDWSENINDYIIKLRSIVKELR